MKKTTAFLMSTVALAASVKIASAEARHPVVSSTVSGHYAHSFVGKSKWATLYDQSTNDEGYAIVSQNFESSFDAYDSQAADDFNVPKGSSWRVHEIDLTGQYFNGPGPALSENVFFYKDRKGLPGKLIHTYPGVAGIDDGFGSFVITLPTKAGAKLKSGHYWVSIQINMDSGTGGEWGWENQSSQEDDPAVWQNPGDGFGTGCTTWTPENQCVVLAPGGQRVSGGGLGDQLYTLKGKSKGG